MSTTITTTIDTPNISCPNCKDVFVHITNVEVFKRTEEDSATGWYLNCEANTVKSDSMQGNPSPRRNGVKLHVQCENCHQVFQYNIYMSIKVKR